MTFAQRRNHLTMHFSEGIPVVKRRASVILGVIGKILKQLDDCQLLKNGFSPHNWVRNLLRAFQPNCYCIFATPRVVQWNNVRYTTWKCTAGELNPTPHGQQQISCFNQIPSVWGFMCLYLHFAYFWSCNLCLCVYLMTRFNVCLYTWVYLTIKNMPASSK